MTTLGGKSRDASDIEKWIYLDSKSTLWSRLKGDARKNQFIFNCIIYIGRKTLCFYSNIKLNMFLQIDGVL